MSPARSLTPHRSWRVRRPDDTLGSGSRDAAPPQPVDKHVGRWSGVTCVARSVVHTCRWVDTCNLCTTTSRRTTRLRTTCGSESSSTDRESYPQPHTQFIHIPEVPYGATHDGSPQNPQLLLRLLTGERWRFRHCRLGISCDIPARTTVAAHGNGRLGSSCARTGLDALDADSVQNTRNTSLRMTCRHTLASTSKFVQTGTGERVLRRTTRSLLPIVPPQRRTPRTRMVST